MNKKYSLLFFICFYSFYLKAQCPLFYDGMGVPSAAPYWISCSGGAFTLNVSSPDALTTYSIDWGDGSGITAGGPQPANTPIVHSYASAIDTFLVTITTNNGTICVLTGQL
jgi:hypothetical protein